MLLSRVAECVYWTGRYLERAEAAARLVKVHTELYCDLPLSTGVGWSPLLLVTGSAEAFGDRAAREDDVVEFLAIDPANSSSILSSLQHARQNLRITRDQFPQSAWEELNNLYLWASDHAHEAVDRRGRGRWTVEIIRRCQLMSGLLADDMSHDDAHAFLQIGRFVERADMTTRVLDVQAGILFGSDGDGVQPYADVTWMSVLQTLSAHQMFQRAMRTGISGPNALRFLLRDGQFPRSVEHCLTRVSQRLLELPAYEEPMAGCAEVQRLLEDVDPATLGPAELHDFVDVVQRSIAGLHDLLVEAYFRVETPASEETLALLA
ncbi:MAG: Protein containing domain [Actinomycetia bacterium]|nr:Protein containing domain [Actinomycetes bacterium]